MWYLITIVGPAIFWWGGWGSAVGPTIVIKYYPYSRRLAINCACPPGRTLYLPSQPQKLAPAKLQPFLLSLSPRTSQCIPHPPLSTIFATASTTAQTSAPSLSSRNGFSRQCSNTLPKGIASSMPLPRTTPRPSPYSSSALTTEGKIH